MTKQKLTPIKHRLRDQLQSMPVPGVLDLTHAEWIPSDPWLRKVPGVKLSVRREHKRFYIFRIA